MSPAVALSSPLQMGHLGCPRAPVLGLCSRGVDARPRAEGTGLRSEHMGPLRARAYLWLSGCSRSEARSQHSATPAPARRSTAAVSVPRARGWSPAAGSPRGASPGGPAPRPAAPPGPHRWLPAPAAPRGRAAAALLLLVLALLTCRRSRAGRAGGRAPGSLGAAVPPAPRGALPQAGRGPPAAGRWASLRPLGEPPPRRPAAIFRGQGARGGGEEEPPHRHRHRHAPGPGGAGTGPGPAAGGRGRAGGGRGVTEAQHSPSRRCSRGRRCSGEQRCGGWGIVQPLPADTPLEESSGVKGGWGTPIPAPGPAARHGQGLRRGQEQGTAPKHQGEAARLQRWVGCCGRI